VRNIEDRAGCFFSFCPLAAIGWLHRKIKNSFYLVIGSPVCESFIQNAFGMMLFAKPRFATAVIEEYDLFLGTSPKRILEFAKEIANGYKIDVLFLLETCPSQLLKLDVARWAEIASAELEIPVINVPISGLDASFTEGEDSILSSLVDLCPSDAHRPNLILVGSLAGSVESEFLYEFRNLKHPVSFLPPAAIGELPSISEKTTAVFLHPYLEQTRKKLAARGCNIVSTVFPLGASASRQFFEDVFNALGVSAKGLAEREANIFARNAELHGRIFGKKFFFFPDTQLEIPLARFLSSLGGEIVELSVPKINTKLLSKELEFLDNGIAIIERADFNEQMNKILLTRPDLIIAPLALTTPLLQKGYKVKHSMDFILLPIQGFSNHRSLVELFTNAMI